MKTYKKLIRSSIYGIILIGVIWGISLSKFEEMDVSQSTVNVEVVQELGSKTSGNREQLRRASNLQEYKGSEEKKIGESLHNKDLGTSRRAIILMYHYTSESNENYMSVPREKFREQMKYLKQNNYNIISLDELYSYYSEGRPIPDKSVVLTFDDGYSNNYTYAYPILKELGFKGTIFVITSKINQEGYLTSDQIKELDQNGISIESHTVNHPQLKLLSYDKQYYELNESKATLEALLGREIKYVTYPYGEFNEDTIRAVTRLNYKMALSTEPDKAGKTNGIYNHHRIAVSGKYDMEHFKALVNKK
jgi:peptidoglycan/xylan/chitin deacetylase (PgdA/CDA1 family)